MKGKIKEIINEDYALVEYYESEKRELGYLYTMDINDIDADIERKINVNEEIEIKEVYYDKYGKPHIIMLDDIEKRIAKVEKFSSYRSKIEKLTKEGGILSIEGLVGFVRGNFALGQEIVAAVTRIKYNKVYLVLESTC